MGFLQGSEEGALGLHVLEDTPDRPWCTPSFFLPLFFRAQSLQSKVLESLDLVSDLWCVEERI